MTYFEFADKENIGKTLEPVRGWRKNMGSRTRRYEENQLSTSAKLTGTGSNFSRLQDWKARVNRGGHPT